MSEDMLGYFKVYPDFPKKGINFYDIQSVLEKPDIWRRVIDSLTALVKESGAELVLGIESRGFITGVPVADKLGLPFGMVRKPGKLPGAILTQDYELEYGSDAVQIQKDLITPGMKVAIVDDLLATGGTMKAAGDLVKAAGGNLVLGVCVIELHELSGRDKLGFPFQGLVRAPLDPF
ncbi:MAG: adenine phosphoribosyltransferase [Alphaproteobacteria bacterium]